MDVIKLHYPLANKQYLTEKTVIAMGFFDGFHRGHQAVLQQAKAEAEKRGASLAVLTYDHHPALVYKKIAPHDKRYITLLNHKLALLEDFGVQKVLLVNYSYQFQSQTPSEFVEHFLKRFNPVAVVAGFDHTYGGSPDDNMENLPKFVNGAFDVLTVPALTQDNQKLSSSRIRRALDASDVETVNQLLGRPFQTQGVIVHGEERGRLLGYPTANVEHSEYQWLPAIGIYVVTVEIAGQKYLGMASIGRNVTFGDDGPMTVEINLIDFNQNIYGEVVRVNWLAHGRGEIKFQTADELVTQLGKDEAATRQYLKNHPDILH